MTMVHRYRKCDETNRAWLQYTQMIVLYNIEISIKNAMEVRERGKQYIIPNVLFMYLPK